MYLCGNFVPIIIVCCVHDIAIYINIICTCQALDFEVHVLFTCNQSVAFVI